MIIKGISASPGIEIGKSYMLNKAKLAVPQYTISISQIENEAARLQRAIDAAAEEIRQDKQKVFSVMGAEQAAIFDAYLSLLYDPAIIAEVEQRLSKELMNVEWTYEHVTREFSIIFEKLDDDYMKERAPDVRDLAQRVIRKLLGIMPAASHRLTHPVILIADELAPSDVAQLTIDKVMGVILETGGLTSHTVIMMRSKGIPVIVGVEGSALSHIRDDEMIIVDGDKGEVCIEPTQEEWCKYLGCVDGKHVLEQRLDLTRKKPAQTLDGQVIRLSANISMPDEIVEALELGVDGIGLFRTEYLFMDRYAPPSEEEQFIMYRNAIQLLQGKPLVFRIMDIGGDKQVRFYSFPLEENPSLGYRGIRFCLGEPDLLETQLRAILRASMYGKVKVLYPMISSLQQIRAVKVLMKEVEAQLLKEGMAYDPHLEIGMMIEVPAAALLADLFAHEVDFFSIGTNDLIQFTLAVDRMNDKIATPHDSYHPAVIRLVKRALDAGKQSGIPVSLCGEMAGDPAAVPLLLGLGLREFSVGNSSVLKVKDRIGEISIADAEATVNHILGLTDSEQVMQQLTSYMTNPIPIGRK
ncbi:phosphoenolpyruvate--protein phosphotransferase [Paenibacillus sepulcri]|uniref:Phosphoenolpyruvate-protein phosphotransferase n=1 Tax=Paenibacillus sepulcri TaxID=359917 RepID=A0ABS7BW29_9BACL|nr:phosphoenolpyruvate--protein phosphotransferase [Paenibacillus sepulcri]